MEGVICNKCGKIKSSFEFYNLKKVEFENQCKNCIAIQRLIDITDLKPKKEPKKEILGKKCSKCSEFKLYECFFEDECTKDGFADSCVNCYPVITINWADYFGLEEEIEGKQCKKCGQFKPYDEFAKNKLSKDGYTIRCSICITSQRASLKENLKEKKCSSCRKIKSFEEFYNDKRKKDGKDSKCKECQKLFYYINRERHRQSSYLSNMKKRSEKHDTTFEPHQRKAILDRDNWKCQICGIKVHDKIKGNWNTPNKAHIDHVIPVSKGGDGEPNNLVTLCRTCNLSKHDKINHQLSLF